MSEEKEEKPTNYWDIFVWDDLSTLAKLAYILFQNQDSEGASYVLYMMCVILEGWTEEEP